MTEKQGKRDRHGEIDRYEEREREIGGRERERDSGREIEREKDEGWKFIEQSYSHSPICTETLTCWYD